MKSQRSSLSLTRGLCASASLIFASLRLHAETFLVTTDLSSGNGSLAEAIANANASPGIDHILFNIPKPGVVTIPVSSPLPDITDPVVIDGSTQPGFIDTPLIELDGRGLKKVPIGLHLLAGSSTIRSLILTHFGNTVPGYGIAISGPGGNTISGCWLGFDVAGTIGNRDSGIYILNSPNNQIGGLTAAERNIISGNGNQGILIEGNLSQGNQILGNWIGLDSTGTHERHNSNYGIEINNAPGNIIGGLTPFARNVISGNGLAQVWILGSESTHNQIFGNYIGTRSDGSALFPKPSNAHGILIDAAPETQVGGTIAGSGNLIGNNQYGISIKNPSAQKNLIQGNSIGIDLNGISPLPNHVGIRIGSGASQNTIGGSEPGSRNVISGNVTDGINLGDVSGTLIQNNFIGTDFSGLNALPNSANVSASGINIGGIFAKADHNTIANNVISGNGGDGIDLVAEQLYDTLVQYNYVGVGADGVTPLGNGGHGIAVLGAQNTQIGSPFGSPFSPGANGTQGGNTIGFNHGSGIFVGGTFGSGGTPSLGTTILNNFIHKQLSHAITEFAGALAFQNVQKSNLPPEVDRGGDGQDAPPLLVTVETIEEDGADVLITLSAPFGAGKSGRIFFTYADQCSEPSSPAYSIEGVGDANGVFRTKQRISKPSPPAHEVLVSGYWNGETSEFVCIAGISACGKLFKSTDLPIQTSVGTSITAQFAYSEAIQATITGLPEGIEKQHAGDPSTLVLGGTPAKAGSYQITIVAESVFTGCKETNVFALKVNPAVTSPILSIQHLPDGSVLVTTEGAEALMCAPQVEGPYMFIDYGSDKSHREHVVAPDDQTKFFKAQAEVESTVQWGGMITDFQGAALGGLSVRFGLGGPTTTTDNAGHFHFDAIPKGLGSMTVSKPITLHDPLTGMMSPFEAFVPLDFNATADESGLSLNVQFEPSDWTLPSTGECRCIPWCSIASLVGNGTRVLGACGGNAGFCESSAVVHFTGPNGFEAIFGQTSKSQTKHASVSSAVAGIWTITTSVCDSVKTQTIEIH